MKKTCSVVLIFALLVLLLMPVGTTSAAAANALVSRQNDPSAPEYFERQLGLDPANMKGLLFREAARISAISEGYPSPDTVADPRFFGRYICREDGFVFVQQCLSDSGFTRGITSNESGFNELTSGLFFGHAGNAAGDLVTFVYNQADSLLFLTLTPAATEPAPLGVPSSYVGELPAWPDGALLLRVEYIYAPFGKGECIDLFVKGLDATGLSNYEQVLTASPHPDAVFATAAEGFAVDPSTGTNILTIPLDGQLYLDENGRIVPAADLVDRLQLSDEPGSSTEAPSDTPPDLAWSGGGFSLMLYADWVFDEAGSGDTFFRFLPGNNDRQGILVENVTQPLDAFFADRMTYVEELATASGATHVQELFAGDANLERLPGALTISYDIFNGEERTGSLMLHAVQGNHADTFLLVYWSAADLGGLPSYANQARRIMESIELTN